MKSVRSSALSYRGKVRPAGTTDDGGSPGAGMSGTHVL